MGRPTASLAGTTPATRRPKRRRRLFTVAGRAAASRGNPALARRAVAPHGGVEIFHAYPVCLTPGPRLNHGGVGCEGKTSLQLCCPLMKTKPQVLIVEDDDEL